MTLDNLKIINLGEIEVTSNLLTLVELIFN
jgi:hypothetical protein